MLLLTFNLGDDLYAIPVSDVIEVIPLVQIKPLRLAPPWVAGLFNYRGSSVPVLDLYQTRPAGRQYQHRG